MQEPLASSSAFANLPPEWLYASGGFTLGVMVAAFIFQMARSKLTIENEKLSSYEFGFHSFDDTRQIFNVRFYLVSIIFLIFDLEIVFLYPIVYDFRFLGFTGFFFVVTFLFIVTVGFVYE